MTADPKENLPQVQVSNKSMRSERGIMGRKTSSGRGVPGLLRDLRLRRRDAPKRTSRNRHYLEPRQPENDRERGSRPASASQARQPPRARGECPSGPATSRTRPARISG